MEQEFHNNAVPSPDDPRDWIAEAIFRPRTELQLPKTLDLRDKLPGVRSQGGRGSCVAFAATVMKEYQERLDVEFKYHMSPEFIYHQRSIKPQSGMYPRDAMSILQHSGCPPEYSLPYQKDDIESIPQKVREEASNFKIKSYARINTIMGLKTALYKNGPCHICFPVYHNQPEFWRASPGEQRTGGHAVAVIGYNAVGFILQNSWGKKWNGDGTVVYPYEDWGVHWEIWTTIDDNSSKPDPPKSINFCLFRGINFVLQRIQKF